MGTYSMCSVLQFPIAQSGRTKFQMSEDKNEYDHMYIGNLANAQILITERLLDAYGKPAPKEPNQRVDGENFNFTNNERVLFWVFNRKLAAAAGHSVASTDIVVIPVMLGLLINWLSEWIIF